jgi:hypothetical protein
MTYQNREYLAERDGIRIDGRSRGAEWALSTILNRVDSDKHGEEEILGSLKGLKKPYKDRRN